jgi:nucleoside-diphosphate-sugar epimerase
MDLGTDTVLVTGASGWLGKSLVQALTRGLPDCPGLTRPAQGLSVRGLVPPGEKTQDDGGKVGYVAGDLRSADDCKRFCAGASGAVLFHAAGVIHPGRAREFDEVNVRGTWNLLRAAADAGVRRVVAVSSNSPCGCNPHPDHLFDEASPYRPYMGYGRSKMFMERLLQTRRESGWFEAVVVRPPWFYGPNQPPRQTLFFRMIRDGKAPIVGTGENLRSMAYVDNLCQGLIRAAAVPRADGKTYWIADERPYSMNEVVDTVERLLETEFGVRCARKRLRLPGAAAWAARVVDAGLQGLGFYHQKIHVLGEMDRTIACSVAAARRELGYAPAVGLEEGMRRSLRWLLDQGVKL